MYFWVVPFPSPCQNPGAFFSSIYYENHVKLLEVNPTGRGLRCHNWVPWSCYFSGLSTLSLQQFTNYRWGFLPQHWLLSCFLSGKLWLTCLQSYRQSLPFILTSLRDLQRAADFLVCSAFHLLLGWGGDFQVFHTCSPKMLSYFYCRVRTGYEKRGRREYRNPLGEVQATLRETHSGFSSLLILLLKKR